MQSEITQDGWGGMPTGWGMRGNYGKPASLQQHDDQYHGGHYSGGKCQYRQAMSKGDNSDVLPGFGQYVSSRHGMFDDLGPKLSPQELDQMAVAEVCRKQGVAFPAKGTVKSGRWLTPTSGRLEYTVMDKDTGLFASGRGNKDYMVLARPEEAMSFSDPDDAAAVAKATGGNAVVLDKKAYLAEQAKTRVNKVEFPDHLDESDLKDFRVTMNGSTEPFVGKIGDSMFIAKRGTHTSADHVRNEDLANKVHLAAGLRAPKSRIYEVSGGEDKRTPAQRYMDEVNGIKGPFKDTVMLAEYIPNSVALDVAWNEAKRDNDKARMKKIRDEVLKAYPLESFLAGIDVFQNDNALVDQDGNLWMVDNGAAFDYRARGGRKGWFNYREDPQDREHGHMSLLNHPSQRLLQDILQGVSEQDILNSTKQYDFEQIVKSLPAEYQTPGLKTYAARLNKLSERDGGTEGVKVTPSINPAFDNIRRDEWQYPARQGTIDEVPYGDNPAFQKAVRKALLRGKKATDVGESFKAFLMWQILPDGKVEAIVNAGTSQALEFVDALNKGGFRNCVSTRTEQPPHIFIPKQG